jgi:hypothetical protein
MEQGLSDESTFKPIVDIMRDEVTLKGRQAAVVEKRAHLKEAGQRMQFNGRTKWQSFNRRAFPQG